MKLQHRYVILFVMFVLAVVSVNLFLAVTSKPSLFSAVQGLPDAIQRRFGAGSAVQSHRFVRQLTAEEFRENPTYKTGIAIVLSVLVVYMSVVDLGTRGQPRSPLTSAVSWF